MKNNYGRINNACFIKFLLLLIITIDLNARTVRSVQSGRWNAATTWNVKPIPGAGDSVIISNNHIVELNVNATVRSLTIILGHLTGTKNLTINNAFQFNNGSLGNAGDITIGGNFIMQDGIIGNLGGTVNGKVIANGRITFQTLAGLNLKKFIYKKELVINQIFAWSGGDIIMGFGGKITINNLGSMQTTGSVPSILTGNGTVDISGILLSNNQLLIDSQVVVNNFGQITSNSQGSILLNGGGSHTGAFISNGTITFKKTHHINGATFSGSITVTNTGKLQLNNNTTFSHTTLTGGGIIAGNFPIVFTNGLVLDDGIINNGANPITIQVSFHWNKGGFENNTNSLPSILVSGNAITNMSSGGVKTLKRKKMTLKNSLWDGGNIQLSDSAIIEIPVNSTLTVNPTNSVIIAGDGTLIILGKLLNSSDQQLTIDNINFENKGIVSQGADAQNTGTLFISAGTNYGVTTQTGIFESGGLNAVINLNGMMNWNGAKAMGAGRFKITGEINLLSPTIFFNANTEILEGGNIHGNHPIRFTGNLIMHDGILASSKSATVDGTFNFKSGKVGDLLTSVNDSLITKGSLLMNDAFDKKIFSKFTMAHGNVSWTKGNIHIVNRFFQIMPGSTFTANGHSSKVDSFQATVLNQGIVTFVNDNWKGTSFTNLGTVMGNTTSVGNTFNQLGTVIPSTIIQGQRIEMSAVSKLKIGIRGNSGANDASGNDVLISKNSVAKINGEIMIQLENGFVPVVGSNFIVFNSNFGYTGQFTSVNGNTPGGFGWILNHDQTDVKVTYCPKLFHDRDEDGFGDDQDFIISCTAVPGFVSLGGDCDDQNKLINPSVNEICNNIDDNCDGKIDNDCFTSAPGLETRSVNKVLIYPNPSNGTINIVSGDFFNKNTIAIFRDLSGRVIFKTNFVFDSNIKSIDLGKEGFIPGNYTLTLMTKNNAESLKVIIIK